MAKDDREVELPRRHETLPGSCRACDSARLRVVHFEVVGYGPGGEHYEQWEVLCLDCGVYTGDAVEVY